MPNGSKKMDGQQCVELTPDFHGESRHEFVARLAYQNWEGRGSHLARPRLTGLQRNKLYTSLWCSQGWFRHPQATSRTWSRRSITSEFADRRSSASGYILECPNVCLPTGCHPPANDRSVQCKFRRVTLVQSLD